MSSAAQVAANQANAQLSTGPRTIEGKAKSSYNALKTGLTGRTILVPKNEAGLYEEHVLNYDARFDPQTPRETELVQSIADCRWRLGSIPGLESALYARGFREFADMFDDEEDQDQRNLLIVGETMTRYRKDFANLMLQEQRLSRRAYQEEDLLKAMQRKRIAEEEEQLALATQFYLAAKKENKPFDPAKLGFEFSVDELERHAEAQIHHQTINKMKCAS